MQTILKKSLQLIFTCFSHRISVTYNVDWDEILLKGSCLENGGLIYMLLCEDFIKFDDCLNQSEIQWRQKKSLHLYAFWHFRACRKGFVLEFFGLQNDNKMLTKQYLPKSCTCTLQMKVWFAVNPVCHALSVFFQKMFLLF